MRISSVARSAHWLWAEHATVASGTFATHSDPVYVDDQMTIFSFR